MTPRLCHHLVQLQRQFAASPAVPEKYELPPEEWEALRADVEKHAWELGRPGPLAREGLEVVHFLLMGVPVVPAPLPFPDQHTALKRLANADLSV